jgi:hypothetical protein
VQAFISSTAQAMTQAALNGQEPQKWVLIPLPLETVKTVPSLWQMQTAWELQALLIGSLIASGSSPLPKAALPFSFPVSLIY